MTHSTPPGWYPDPYGGGGQRYWTGQVWQPIPPVPGQSRKSSPLKVLAIVGAAIFLLVVGCTALVEVIGGSHGAKNNAASSATHKPSAQDLDPSTYQPISLRDYALLVKNPDAAKGRKLIVHGVVTQFDSATGTSDFRADTGAEPMGRRYDYQQNTLVHAPDPAILTNVVEKDMVTMYVDVAGSYSYDTQIGGHTTVPLFNVYIIKVTNSGQ